MKKLIFSNQRVNKEEFVNNRDYRQIRKKEYLSLLLLEGIIKKLSSCFREFVHRRQIQTPYDKTLAQYTLKIATTLLSFSTVGETFKERFCNKSVIRNLVGALPSCYETEASLLIQSLARVVSTTISVSQIHSVGPAIGPLLDLVVTSLRKKTKIINSIWSSSTTFLYFLLRPTGFEMDKYVKSLLSTCFN